MNSYTYDIGNGYGKCCDCDRAIIMDSRRNDWTRCPTCGELVCEKCYEFHKHCPLCGDRLNARGECRDCKGQEQCQLCGRLLDNRGNCKSCRQAQMMADDRHKER